MGDLIFTEQLKSIQDYAEVIETLEKVGYKVVKPEDQIMYTISSEMNHPRTIKLWRGGVLVFDGVDKSVMLGHRSL